MKLKRKRRNEHQFNIQIMTNSRNDKSTWATGGGVILGVGVGFFFLQSGASLAFVGSILAGLGIGLIITSILSSRKK
jgi:hypothetical protein